MGGHPSKKIIGTESKRLSGKKIVLGITGSVAIVRAFELARGLMRRGADVVVVMSPAALVLASAELFRYASGNEVITELSGGVEHVGLLGNRGSADLLAVAPCTANTLGKIAFGVDDTAVTTCATTALGSGKPVVIAPAMHGSMYLHSAVAANIGKLKKAGVAFVGPDAAEGKAKVASNAEIILEIERTLSKGLLRGKRVMVSSGATHEAVDGMRIMTNRSTGTMGREIAREAYRQGAEVVLVQGMQHADVERGIRDVRVCAYWEMRKAVFMELGKGCDLFISAAGVSDFAPETRKGKISSGKAGEIRLKPLPKIVSDARKKFPKLGIIGFKAEAGVSDAELEKRAREKMKEDKMIAVVANEVSKRGMGTEETRALAVSGRGKKWFSGKKGEVSQGILEFCLK